MLNKLKELDDPWVVALDRAKQAGKLLARLLLMNHGKDCFETQHGLNFEEKVTTCVNAYNLALFQQSKRNTKGNSEKRPIVLVGYGMGARLIVHCLETLEEEGGIAGRGIIEHVVLIGHDLTNRIS